MYILVFILTLLTLVVVHELGHFLAAKRFGIKVLEFGFGLPPRAWGKKIGETLVSINWLPFGGFVRLLGEDETDPQVLNEKRSFANQNVSKRMVVVVAGVVMNLLLSWVLFYIVLGSQGFKYKIEDLKDNHHFFGVSQTNENVILVGQVAKDSPADKAGIKSGTRIVAFNNHFINNSDQLISETKANAGKEIKLTLLSEQNNKYQVVLLTPRVNPPAGQGALGISLGSFKRATLDYNQPAGKLLAGPIHSLNIISYSADVIASSVVLAFAQKDVSPVADNVTGPIGIVYVTKIILEFSTFITLLDFIANISLSLALMNVLPIPALDGGRLFFLMIEAVLGGKKVPAHIESKIHAAGMALLLTLIFLISYKDVQRFLPKLPFF